MKKKTQKKIIKTPRKRIIKAPRKTTPKIKEVSLKLNYIAFGIAAVIFLALGCFATMAGFNPGRDIAVGYSDHARIDYKVYLKKNNFYKEPYLRSGMSYVTSLIDYLDLDFGYNLDFNDPVDLDYRYHFVATVTADKARSGASTSTGGKGEFLSRTYNLTDEVTDRKEDIRNLSLSEHFDINYDEYNKFLSDFKASTRVAATGNLKISLVFDGTAYSDAIGEPVAIEYEEVYLNIPLAESSVEATVTGTSSEPRSHTITHHVEQNVIMSILLRIVGILMIIAGIFVGAVAVRDYHDRQSDRRFENTVKHLLSTYDSVIVEVDKQPKLSGMNVLTVNDFDELLDVYNSIHMPVSYYRDKIGAHFIVISEHMAWRYSILERDFRKKK